MLLLKLDSPLIVVRKKFNNMNDLMEVDRVMHKYEIYK